MSNNSVRETLKKAQALLAPSAKNVAPGKSTGAALIREASELAAGMEEIAEASAEAGKKDGLGASSRREAVTEAHHQIDELREARSEVALRGLSRNETAADLGQVMNRLGEAEAGLARAVEARNRVPSALPTTPAQTTVQKLGPTGIVKKLGRIGRIRLKLKP